MSWRDAWKLSQIGFTELSVQAIYSFRQGTLPPPLPANELVPRARRSVRQSKAVVGLLFVFIALVAAAGLSPSGQQVAPNGLPSGLYVGGVLTGLLIVELLLIWWSGLQVLPTYLGSGILPLFETLPIPRKTVERAAILLFYRLFDLPILLSLILIPLAVGAGLGSVWGGLAIIPAVFAVVVVALVLSLRTGRFFLHRVLGARRGGGHTVLRWAYLVVWAIPAFALYGFITGAPRFFNALTALVNSGPSYAVTVVLSIFPFPLTLLSPLAAGGPSVLGAAEPSLGGILIAAVLYGGLIVWAFIWLLGAPLRLARLPVQSTLGAAPRKVLLFPHRIFWAVLVKDLRTASRTPGYAFLILLPLLNSIAIGLFTYVSNPPPSDTFNLAVAAVTVAALLAIVFGPAFFAIEVMGHGYSRTLPVPERSLLLGKVSLVALLYLLASGIVLGLTLLRVFSPALFVAFILAEFPGVLAASLLELALLFRLARKSGLPITNLYSGAWRVLTVSIPGLIVVGLPLLAYTYLRSGSTELAIAAMAAVSLVELAICAPFALGTHQGVRR